MKKDFIDYVNIIESLRVDDFYDIFSDQELIELIDSTPELWDENGDLIDE